MDQLEIEVAALQTLRFCRKSRKDFTEFGYPPKFVQMVSDLANVYPDRTPPGWILQQGRKPKEYYEIMNDKTLLSRVLSYFEEK